MTESVGPPASLADRGARIHLDTERMLRSPSGALLPYGVRTIIRDLAELVRDLSESAERAGHGKS